MVVFLHRFPSLLHLETPGHRWVWASSHVELLCEVWPLALAETQAQVALQLHGAPRPAGAVVVLLVLFLQVQSQASLDSQALPWEEVVVETARHLMLAVLLPNKEKFRHLLFWVFLVAKQLHLELLATEAVVVVAQLILSLRVECRAHSAA